MTSPGYTHPLYLLPFDHRASYIKGMFDLHPPLDAAQHDRVADSKRLIYEGFERAVADGVPLDRAGILVDEEFGAAIQRDARKLGAITALPVEGSGSDEFHFEYGDDFAAHIAAFAPTFAKVLVRYNPEGDGELNARQTARLQQLSTHCRGVGQRFMFELLVPATDGQLADLAGDKNAYDLKLRPQLMAQAIRALQDAGVEPDVWKIEGLDRREDCEMLSALARRDGRGEVGCILLGRGADDAKVEEWLRTAAGVPGFIGFAVGRTSFWDPVAGYFKQGMARDAAAAEIAARYRRWVDVFEGASHAAH
jgi:myo-inositol catabolism protein IolC